MLEEVLTIGFTRSTAEHFFGRLREARVQLVVDVRLHNESQLAGFAKSSDIPFFVRELCGAEYRHEPRFAPDASLFDGYRKQKMPWEWLEAGYRELMGKRDLPASLLREDFAARTVLLCSEPTPEHCHRRIFAELLAGQWQLPLRHL